MQNLDWEFAIINEKQTVNAFVVPGGKVVIYTGLLLNLIRSDDELAAVMAHEVAHVVARHTVSSMSAWSEFLHDSLLALVVYPEINYVDLENPANSHLRRLLFLIECQWTSYFLGIRAS